MIQVIQLILRKSHTATSRLFDVSRLAQSKHIICLIECLKSLLNRDKKISIKSNFSCLPAVTLTVYDITEYDPPQDIRAQRDLVIWGHTSKDSEQTHTAILVHSEPVRQNDSSHSPLSKHKAAKCYPFKTPPTLSNLIRASALNWHPMYVKE